MSADAPRWRAEDPDGSLKRQAEWLNQKVRETFLSDGFHTELFFLYQADGKAAITQAPRGVNRDVFAVQFKQSLRQQDVFGVIHVVEAWSYFPKQPGDHTMKQILQGEIAVSELNQGDRTEVLMVRAEGRNGYCMLWMSPIIRHPRAVALADPITMADPPGGRFGRFFG